MKNFSFIVLGLFVSLMMWNCKGQATGDNNSDGADSVVATENPLKVGMPDMVKFVRVVADESTEVFMEPDAESPWRVLWMEDLESDMADIVYMWSNEDVPDDYRCDEAPAYAGDVLAVVGEEGDFYKVSIRNDLSMLNYGYVKKADVEDVEAEPMNLDDLLEGIEYIHIRVVKDGKYKGLVLRSIMDELQGDKFEVGVLLDNVLAFPEENSFFIEYDPNVKELTFAADVPNNNTPNYFTFPKSMAFIGENGYPEGFDPNKLTDEQIDRIVKDMMKAESEFVKYEFVIPMTEGGVRTFWLKSK
ncbi:MAG: hypothetical protein J6T38_11270 [Bacteroidaceae bacterium]|nr:hypothetical protein [Bacteroidaceae bacterium]